MELLPRKASCLETNQKMLGFFSLGVTHLFLDTEIDNEGLIVFTKHDAPFHKGNRLSLCTVTTIGIYKDGDSRMKGKAYLEFLTFQAFLMSHMALLRLKAPLMLMSIAPIKYLWWITA